MHAEQFNFSHAFHVQNNLSNFFCLLSHFFIRKSVRSQSVNRTENVVKSVVVKWPDNSCGEIFFNVFAHISDFLISRANIFFRNIFVQFNINYCKICSRVAFYIFQTGRILQFFFNFIRNLQRNLFGVRSGPRNSYNHLPNCKRRIFHSAEIKICKNSANRRHKNKIPNKTLIFQRHFS